MIHGLLRFSVTNADLLHRSALCTAMTKSHPSTEDRILKLARDFNVDLGKVGIELLDVKMLQL